MTKSERITEARITKGISIARDVSDFVIRNSFGFRISSFGFLWVYERCQ